MLATLGMFITGAAAIFFKHKGENRTCMLCDINIMKREVARKDTG